MGCDGGTIPKRDELVRTKRKPEQVSKEAELVVKWHHCALSQEPLRKPIVACELGHLFNKESVIEFLLDKSSHEMTAKFDYIRGLKDVKELQLTANPAYNASKDTAIAGEDRRVDPYICPITGLEMNGRYRFCYLLSCACALSERALNEIKDGLCIKCGKAYTPDDVILLNGSDEDVERLQKQMEQRRAAAKQMRKSKKDKVKPCATATETSGADSASTSGESSKDSDGPPTKKSKLSTADSQTVQPKEQLAGAKTSGKTSASNEEPAKGAAGGSRSAHSKLVGDSKGKADQQKKPKNIQDDPNASEAYKSLFTSHSSAKNQPKAHWVTYNPLYY